MRLCPAHKYTDKPIFWRYIYELPLQSLRRRQHVVDHHPAAPCSFLLRLRLTDAAVDAIRHPPAGTITDVEMIPLAADADAVIESGCLI